ncbi:MAG: hypothetical protein IJJ21_05235, partial [Firmicutes bacterium]|nr:hypothetical protein [Bacillota bacterium]
MKNTNVRTIAAITIFAVIIVFTLGSFAFFRSAKYIKAEINEKIGKTTEDYASDFSESLNHMVGLTDSLTAYVDITLDKKAFSSGDTAYIAEYRE